MAGHNTQATVQTPVVYERMIPHPLDKWSNISSLTQVTTQLPSVIRYAGMLVWVEDKKEFYHFKDGTADNQLVPLSTSLEGIRTYDTLVNTTANNKIEIKHDLGAANISITFQHNDEMLLVGWKRGKIDGSDKGNYIHFATDVDYVGLRVFIISKDLAPSQPTHPNLDNELDAITLKLNTTHTNLDTMQEVGDAIIALQTTVGNHTTALTTTHSEYDTFQEIGDKLNSLSENLRDVDTALSTTSTNLVENKAVTLALNTKIADAPNDVNTYARKGGAWVEIQSDFSKMSDISVWIDSTIPNSTNAKIGDIDRPFKNLTDAFAALPTYSGETVTVIFKNGGTHVGTTIPTRNLKFVSRNLVTLDFTGINSTTTKHVIDYDSGVYADIEFVGGTISIKSDTTTEHRFIPKPTTTYFCRILGHINEFDWYGANGSSTGDFVLGSFLKTSIRINKLYSRSTNGNYFIGFCRGSVIDIDLLEATSLFTREVTRKPAINDGLEPIYKVREINFVSNSKVFFRGSKLEISKISGGSGSALLRAEKYIFKDTENTDNVNVSLDECIYVSGNYNVQASPLRTFTQVLATTFEDFHGWVTNLTSNHADTKYVFKGTNHIYVPDTFISAHASQNDTCTIESGVTTVTQTSVSSNLFGSTAANNKLIIKGEFYHNSNNLNISIEYQNNKQRGIDVKDINGVVKFRTEELGLRVAGDVDFDAVTRNITVGGRVPNTVFVSTSGNDSTAVIGDYTKPFLTDSAAIAAIPRGRADVVYTLHVLSNEYTFNSTTMPQRYFRITHLGTGILDFSSFAGTNVGTQTYPFELYAPRATFKHASATQTSLFGSVNKWSKIEVGKADIQTDSTASGFFKSNIDTSNISYFKCNGLFEVASSKNYIMGISGKVTIGKLKLNGSVNFTASATDMHLFFDEIENTSGNNYIIPTNLGGTTKVEICKITATSGNLYIRRTYVNDIFHLIFHNCPITGAGQVIALDNFNGSCNATITGTTDPSTNGICLYRLTGGSNFGGKVTLKDFTGRIGGTLPFSIFDQQKLDIINSNIFTTDKSFSSSSGIISELRLFGINTFTHNTPGALFDGVTSAQTVQKYGRIYTNATSIGANVTINDNTPNTF